MAGAIEEQTVNIVYTDLERSTTLWEEHPDEMTMVLREHLDVIERAVVDNGGRVFQWTGDGLVALFDQPEDAILATATAQRELALGADEGFGRLKSRMGVHTGPCKVYGGYYYGRALNRGARLHTAAHGDQILVSGATASLLEDKLPGELELLHLGEYWLRDIREAEQVYQLMGPGLVATFPDLATRATSADELPRSMTSFVGRQDEVEALGALIAENGRRCVSLIGGAGVGKTRLALRLAEDLWRHFRDGVVWVELSEDTRSGSDLLMTIANHLGVHLDPASPEPANDLARSLASSELLLVLDNCEVSPAVASQLTTAMGGNAPGVAVLATSREPLSVDGEIRWAVQPLPVGEAVDLAPAAALQLFEERALAVRPDLNFDAATRMTAHQIVSNLDGVPLAVEQAAATLDVYALDELAETTSDHVAPALEDETRLAGSIERSIARLTDEEAAFLFQLPVFSGAIHARAAAGVCLGDEAAEQRAQLLLARLARTSLVQALLGGGRAYYRLLPPVRAHILSRSTPNEELAEAHFEHFSRLALEEGRAYRAGDQTIPIERLGVSWEDIRIALNAAVEAGRFAAAAELVAEVHEFALFSMRTEIYRWAAVIVEHSEQIEDIDLRSEIHGIDALGAWFRGDMRQALALGIQTLELEAAPRAAVNANRTMMSALSYLGRMEEAITYYLAVLDSCRHSDEAFWRLDGIASESIGLCMISDHEGAERLARSAVEFATTTANQDCLYWAHYALGHAVAATDIRVARASFERAVAEADSIGSHWNRMNGRLELLVLSRRHERFDILNAQTAWELLGRFALAGVGAQLAQLSIEVAWMLAKGGHHSLAADLFRSTASKPRMPRPDDGQLMAQVAEAVGVSVADPKSDFASEREIVAMCRHGLTLLLGHRDGEPY